MTNKTIINSQWLMRELLNGPNGTFTDTNSQNPKTQTMSEETNATMIKKENAIDNGLKEESKENGKILPINVFEDSIDAEREEGELDESESEIELKASMISINMKSSIADTATVENLSDMETRDCASSIKYESKISNVMPCLQQNAEYDRARRRQEEELVVDTNYFGSEDDELEIRIIKELNEDMQILKSKCSEIKTKIETASRRMSLGDLNEKILELKMELSRCMECFKNLEPKNYNKCQKTSTVTKNNGKDSESSFKSTTAAELNRFKCYEKKNCGTSDNEKEYKLPKNVCPFSKYHKKFCCQTYPNTASTSISSDTCPSAESSNVKTTDDGYISKTSDESCSLICRQVDFINKHVSNLSLCGKHASKCGNRSQNSESNNEKQKFGGELGTSGDTESLLSFSKLEKRKELGKNIAPGKKIKMSNHAVSNISNKSPHVDEGFKHKKMQTLNYFSTKLPLANVLQKPTESQISNADFSKSSNIKPKKEPNFEKFTGEIKTLEDMESFLSFLRKRKALNEEECKKSESTSKGKNVVPSGDKSNFNRKNSKDMVTTGKVLCEKSSGVIKNLEKSDHRKSREFQEDESSLCIKMNCNRIRKRDGELILRPISVGSQSKVSNSNIIPRQADKGSNGSNRENEEISSEEIRSPLQQLKAEETKVRKSEEISVDHSNHEMKVDRFLKLARDRRKAKLMACVATTPERISKILKDLKEKKLELIGDKSTQYKKVLQKIVSETKTVSIA